MALRVSCSLASSFSIGWAGPNQMWTEKEGRRLGNGSEVGSSWVGVGMGVLQGQDYVSSTNFWLLRV